MTVTDEHAHDSKMLPKLLKVTKNQIICQLARYLQMDNVSEVSFKLYDMYKNKFEL